MEVEHHKNHLHSSKTDADAHSQHCNNNRHHKIPPSNSNFTQPSEPEPEYQKQVIKAVFGESSSESEQEHENEDSNSDSDSHCLDEYQKQRIKDVFGDSSSESEEKDENEDFDSDCLDEYQKQMIKDVFGDSSSESEGEDYRNPNRHWSKVEGITGLWLCSRFLSSRQQSILLRHIEDEGWFKEEAQNQAMRFGDLPFWAVDLSSAIHKVIHTSDQESDTKTLNHNRNDTCIFASHLLSRNPFFDQLIVNVYQPGEGICAHFDLMRFEDGIAIVSLESPCVMHFSPVGNDEEEEVRLATKIPVYLIPGSLVVMCGEARYNWKHEINRKPGFQIWEGQEIVQNKRTSITLRKLCPSE